jgi:pyruvate ferredoxin oxidoreductase delta subunit
MVVTEELLIKGVILLDISKKGSMDVSSWRANRPVFNLDKCIACGLCLSYCPEAALIEGEDKKPRIDLRFCKGCGLCAYECPVNAIEMKGEGE